MTNLKAIGLVIAAILLTTGCQSKLKCSENLEIPISSCLSRNSSGHEFKKDDWVLINCRNKKVIIQYGNITGDVCEGNLGRRG